MSDSQSGLCSRFIVDLLMQHEGLLCESNRWKLTGEHEENEPNK